MRVREDGGDGGGGGGGQGGGQRRGMAHENWYLSQYFFHSHPFGRFTIMSSSGREDGAEA